MYRKIQPTTYSIYLDYEKKAYKLGKALGKRKEE
jgi:hypothetical protein